MAKPEEKIVTLIKDGGEKYLNHESKLIEILIEDGWKLEEEKKTTKKKVEKDGDSE